MGETYICFFNKNICEWQRNRMYQKNTTRRKPEHSGVRERQNKDKMLKAANNTNTPIIMTATGSFFKLLLHECVQKNLYCEFYWQGYLFIYSSIFLKVWWKACSGVSTDISTYVLYPFPNNTNQIESIFPEFSSLPLLFLFPGAHCKYFHLSAC